MRPEGALDRGERRREVPSVGLDDRAGARRQSKRSSAIEPVCVLLKLEKERLGLRLLTQRGERFDLVCEGEQAG